MQLPDNLLKTIAVSVTMGIATSCGLHDADNAPAMCTEDCAEECKGECTKAGSQGQTTQTYNWDNCPACGMG